MFRPKIYRFARFSAILIYLSLAFCICKRQQRLSVRNILPHPLRTYKAPIYCVEKSKPILPPAFANFNSGFRNNRSKKLPYLLIIRRYTAPKKVNLKLLCLFFQQAVTALCNVISRISIFSTILRYYTSLGSSVTISPKNRASPNKISSVLRFKIS